MDELDLPSSPRKKLKLDEDAETANPASDAPATPELIPRSHTASTNQISEPTRISASATISPSQASTSATQIAVPTSAMPDNKVENGHLHVEAQFNLSGEGAVDASKAQSRFTNVAGPLDEGSKEAVCGITEFVSPDLLGFSGILKKRFVFLIATIHHG